MFDEMDESNIDIKVGDVVMSRDKGLLPRLIRAFTGATYNHAGIVIESCGDLCVLESLARGTMVRYTMDDWMKKNLDRQERFVVLRPGYDEWKSKFKLRLRDVRGKQYGYTDLIRQAIYQITGRWFANKKRKHLHTVYCTELIAYIYQEVFPEYWKVAPDELLLSDSFIQVLQG